VADFHTPTLKVLSNYTGTFHPQDAAGIKANLFAQLFEPVLWHANLMYAVDQGCDTIIEFGGGIGKGDSAAEKKPNLAGIVKKTFRRHDTPPQYHSVINDSTLNQAASIFSATPTT
jgi:[acyl-carrier-protein] S-malonyltransferase